MINPGLESRDWQLDMQLIGKVVFSATALLIFGLAYRFYKSRSPERGEFHRDGANGAATEESALLVAPKWNHLDEETVAVRQRHVKNKLNRGGHKCPESQQVGTEGQEAQNVHLKAQTGTGCPDGETRGNNIDLRCGHQEELKNVEIKEFGEVCDPLQRQCPNTERDKAQDIEESTEELGDSNKASSGTASTSETSRQEPEGKEMYENVDSGFLRQTTKNVTASSAMDFSIKENIDDVQRLHQFSSVAEVQVEESIFTDKQDTSPTPQQGHVRGKIYSYHVESTSESVTTDRNYKFGAAHSGASLGHLNTDRGDEESKTGLLGHLEDVADDRVDLSVRQDLPNPNGNTQEINTMGNLGANHDSVNFIPSVTGPLLSSTETSATSTDTFHVTLSSGSTFDIHIDVENCYEVLCLAKKHNLDFIKRAAYKIMSDNYLQVLQNPAVFGRLNAAERDLILDNRMKGKKVVVVADVDTQGYSTSQSTSSLSYYDSEKDSWLPLTQIPVEAVSRGCAMTTMFNYLFVVLGCEGPGRQIKPSKRVFCYNPLTDHWKEISPLKEARPHCKLVALDGYLYAIGGECLHTVERYDSRQNRWSYVAPLPNDTFAVAHMATVCEDGIYVTGGTIRYILLRYHQKENIWTSTLISGSKDRTTEMVAANNFLYRFDLNRSMGISVHRCSIRARIWYECASYALPYPASFQCAVIGNNIYCISRSFHLRFLADDISPRFMKDQLRIPTLPQGILFPFVLVFAATL